MLGLSDFQFNIQRKQSYQFAFLLILHLAFCYHEVALHFILSKIYSSLIELSREQRKSENVASTTINLL